MVMRRAQKAEADGMAEKQRLGGRICERLQAQVRGRSFPQVLQMFAVEVSRRATRHPPPAIQNGQQWWYIS